MRRLPVYVLLDCSESMVGETIGSVNQGLDMLLRQLRTDPHALETAWLSIITFSQDAEQLVPLTELTDVQTPELKVRPGTSLGKALSLLRNCIAGEVKTTTKDRKGDYRPLVFLLTDGQPTDDWRVVKQAVDRLTTPKIANFYAIGCGDDVDYDMLNEVADAVFKLSDMTPEALKRLFIWLTASVAGASMGAGQGEAYDGIDLDKKPSEVMEVAPGSHPRYEGLPLQVFVKAYCQRQKLPYLMRYRLVPEMQRYEPLKAHKLEVSDEVGGFDVPSINVSMLMGCPPCPYCFNPLVAVCGCDAVMCLPENPPREVTCPRCEQQMPLEAADDDFSISQSAG